MKVKVVPYQELPEHIKTNANPTSKFLLIYHNDNLLDYYSDGNLVDGFEKLQPLIEWIEKAYCLGKGNNDKLSQKDLIYVAHLLAEADRKILTKAAQDSYEYRKAIESARKFDEISDRFYKGLEVTEVYDFENKLVAYKVKGEGGFTYSLNSQGNSCTCQTGMMGTKICWHMRAIEVYNETKELCKSK